jgi:hypothetical protein
LNFCINFCLCLLRTSEKGVMYYLMKKINNTISQNVCLELNVNKQLHMPKMQCCKNKSQSILLKLKFVTIKWICEKQTQ